MDDGVRTINQGRHLSLRCEGAMARLIVCYDLDMGDARVFRWRWVDEDVAAMIVPSRADRSGGRSGLQQLFSQREVRPGTWAKGGPRAA